MKNIMLDIETLGTRPGCAVLSIGAVEFDPWAPAKQRIGRTFLVNIQLQSSLFAGLTIDPQTLAWWMKPEHALARLALQEQSHLPLDLALRQLAEFIATAPAGTELWCKGGSFDFPILHAAFAAAGIAQPWPYWQERDHRTLLKVCQARGYAPPERHDTAHSALDDARYQATVAIECLRLIGKPGTKAR